MLKHVFDILLEIFLNKIAKVVISAVQSRIFATEEQNTNLGSEENKALPLEISKSSKAINQSDYLIGLEDFEAALGDIVEGLTKSQQSGVARRYLAIQYIQAWINLSLSMLTLAKRHLTLTAKRTVKIEETKLPQNKIE